MVLRTLPALVLAVLAVAGPAAADDGAPDAPGLTQPSAASFQTAQPGVADRLLASDVDGSAATSDCSLYKLTTPGQNTQATDAFMLDPDGCYRRFVNSCLDLECDPLSTRDCWAALVELSSAFA